MSGTVSAFADRYDSCYNEPCGHLGTRACLECRRERLEEYADWSVEEIDKLRRHVKFLERALTTSEKQVAKLTEELENE